MSAIGSLLAAQGLAGASLAAQGLPEAGVEVGGRSGLMGDGGPEEAPRLMEI